MLTDRQIGIETMRALVDFLDGKPFVALLVGAIALLILETGVHERGEHVLPILVAVGYWFAFQKES